MSLKSPQVIALSTGTIVRTIAVLLALWGLWMISDIILIVFVALLLAGVIYPFVSWAASHRIPKGVAVILLYFILFGLLAVSFVLLVPALYNEARMLSTSYNDAGSPSWISGWMNGLRDLSDRYSFIQGLQVNVADVRRYLGESFSGFFHTLTGVFGGIAGVVVVLVLSFYIIVEESAIKTLFRNLIPNEYQQLGSNLIWQVINRLGDWLRGQLILGLVIGLACIIVYSIIGVPYPLILGLVAGLLEFIPYLGPLLAAIPALFLSATVSPLTVVFTLIAIVLIQQFENHVVVPKVMEKTVGLNPIISIVALMIGAQLFGVAGALFSIPVATTISVLVTELLDYRKTHSFKSV